MEKTMSDKIEDLAARLETLPATNPLDAIWKTVAERGWLDSEPPEYSDEDRCKALLEIARLFAATTDLGAESPRGGAVRHDVRMYLKQALGEIDPALYARWRSDLEDIIGC
jgi:hypothetical protein